MSIMEENDVCAEEEAGRAWAQEHGASFVTAMREIVDRERSPAATDLSERMGERYDRARAFMQGVWVAFDDGIDTVVWGRD